MPELTPLRVLIVEDSADDAELLIRELARSYAVTSWRVQTGEALSAALDAATWDLVISDHSLPQFSAAQALDVIRSRDHNLPFIIVSGTIDEDAAVAAMRAGANDYFSKDKLARLLPAVQRELAEADARVERQRFETRLRQAEQQFTTVFQASPVAIALVALSDGRLLDVNPRFLASFGYRRDEVIGKTTGELGIFVHKEQNDALIPVQRQTLYQEEVLLRTRNGDVRSALVSVEQTEFDNQPCALAMIHDITPRKQAEEQLQASEKRLRSLLENSYDGVALLDAKGRIRYTSPSTRAILGYDDDELISRVTLTLVHPADVDFVAQGYRTLVRTPGQSQMFTYRLRHKDGSYRWVESIATNLLHDSAVSAIVANYRDITERKRIEDAIRESEQFAHATVDALSAHIAILDQNGVVIAVNHAWKQFALQNGAECPALNCFVGANYLTVAETAAGKDAEYGWALAAGIRQMYSGERDSYTIEYPCHSPQEERWFLCRVTRFQGEGPTRLVVAHENISEQKVAEHELAALYNATSVLFEAENVDQLGHQVVGVVVKEFGTVNCGLLLQAPDGLTARSVALAGEHRLTVGDTIQIDGRGLIARALRTGEVVHAPDVTLEPDYYNADPETRSELVIPLIGAKGTLGALDLQSTRLAAFSERDQRILMAFAERASAALETLLLYEEINRYAGELEWSVAKRTAELFQAKEHVEAILNNSSDAIVLTNLNGDIERMNPAFWQMFGYTEADPQPCSLPEHFEPEYLDPLKRLLHEVATTYLPARIELVCRRRDGTTFDADVAIAPVMEYDSQEFSVIYSLRDITVRKKAEENLRLALVKERELNELKSRFTSMVSHEFRNPLAVIQSAADLVMHYGSRMSEARKLEQVNEITVQVRRLTDLLDDILTVNRTASKGVELQPQPLDLNAFFNDLVRQMRLTTHRHSIELVIHGDNLQMVADPKLLYQTVANLTSNAIKYSPDGGTVRLEVQREAEQVRIRVIDQGIGIPDADKDHLFDIFHRASNVGDISGTGLGLAIVKQAVEAHQGTVTVESVEGQGSTFTIILPLGTPPHSRYNPSGSP
jgi:PAS domain S-box-containing protein